MGQARTQRPSWPQNSHKYSTGNNNNNNNNNKKLNISRELVAPRNKYIYIIY